LSAEPTPLDRIPAGYPRPEGLGAHPEGPLRERLSAEERRSLTSSEFRMRPRERRVYTRALEALRTEGPPFVVSGLFALHQHTGIYRETKDLDVMLQASDVERAAQVLKRAGFRVVLHASHWLAKARDGELFVDLVYGMANGLHLIDQNWIDCAYGGEVADISVLVAAPEDLIFHRLFIWERHRSDMSDIAHLILIYGRRMDWERLVRRAGDHWRLLLAQIHFFDFVYPGRGDSVPRSVREELLERARDALHEDDTPRDICQGTLISRFSFAIDVKEWGFRDMRSESVDAARSLPIIREIEASPVWDAIEDSQMEEQTSPVPWGVPWEPQSAEGGG
jgi:hypothetical protein